MERLLAQIDKGVGQSQREEEPAGAFISLTGHTGV